MASSLGATFFRLRRTLSLSNSKQSWQERVSAALLIGLAFAIYWFRSRLSLTQEVLLWGFLALITAIVLRRGWLRLAGPLLFYELLRLARRRRHFVGRSLFPIPLAILIWWFYFWTVAIGTRKLERNEMADFSMTFFYLFSSVQFFMVLLLTPAYTAGAIAEEKDRKTLEFLLATDLRSREIVISKLLSRLVNLAFLVMTGLPILSLIQFLGGVDPNLVLASFAATGISMASLAGFGILNSVLCKRSRDAIAATYLGAAGYLVLSSASWLLLSPSLGLGAFPSTKTWTSPITLDGIVPAINIGNPFSAIAELFNPLSGLQLGDLLPGVVARYVLFHGAIAIACPLFALLRLRAVAEKQSYAKSRKISWWKRSRLRPPMGRQPMLWKEIFFESGLRLNLLSRFVIFLLVLGTFVPVGFIVAEQSHAGMFQATSQFGKDINVWIRILGTIVACLLLLGVAVRASSTVSGERDRQTLDALLASPLESSAILFAKWVGSICSVRWGWVWLGLIYLIGLLSGGLDFLAMNLLVLAWLVYAGGVAMFGVWSSVACRTTLRATMWTLVLTIGTGVGHWLMWIFIYPLWSAVGGDMNALTSILKFEIGFTPPIAMGYAFAFSDANSSPGEAGEMLGFALLGLLCWVLIAAAVWRMTSVRFEAVTERERLPQPPPAPARRPTVSASTPATIETSGSP